jgi:hypothetical protein
LYNQNQYPLKNDFSSVLKTDVIDFNISELFIKILTQSGDAMQLYKVVISADSAISQFCCSWSIYINFLYRSSFLEFLEAGIK